MRGQPLFYSGWSSFAAGRALTGKLLYEIEFTRIGLIFPYGSDKI